MKDRNSFFDAQAAFCPAFDRGAFRYAAAGYIKLLIRARWKANPRFLSTEMISAWNLSDIQQDSLPSWQLLYFAALSLGHLNREFLPRCGSGGVAITSKATPEGRLISNLAFLVNYGLSSGPDHNHSLLAASQDLRDGKSLDWDQLIDWSTLGSIRNDLNLLPHPESRPQLTFHRENLTVALHGQIHRGIDPVTFAILEEIWNARPGKTSATILQTLPGLKGKNISRELKKLPADLRAIVRSAGGSGYWIELPPPDCS